MPQSIDLVKKFYGIKEDYIAEDVAENLLKGRATMNMLLELILKIKR